MYAVTPRPPNSFEIYLIKVSNNTERTDSGTEFICLHSISKHIDISSHTPHPFEKFWILICVANKRALILQEPITMNLYDFSPYTFNDFFPSLMDFLIFPVKFSYIRLNYEIHPSLSLKIIATLYYGNYLTRVMRSAVTVYKYNTRGLSTMFYIWHVHLT